MYPDDIVDPKSHVSAPGGAPSTSELVSATRISSKGQPKDMATTCATLVWIPGATGTAGTTFFWGLKHPYDDDFVGFPQIFCSVAIVFQPCGSNKGSKRRSSMTFFEGQCDQNHRAPQISSPSDHRDCRVNY